MSWQFAAQSPAELAKIGKALFNASNQTALDEQVQMTRLLESLAETQLLQYPLGVSHTGISAIPDFQLKSDSVPIAVEMAKVTTTNLEHARSLQRKMPEPPSHFEVRDLCYPELFALTLKRGRDAWSKFVAARMPEQCLTWLSVWNGQEKVPENVKELLVAGLNSIIDGPPIAEDPALAHAQPTPQITKVEGFPCEETPRNRKGWLEDAFWEHLAVPINRTLMVTPFIREPDAKMKKPEVLQTAFIVPVFDTTGVTPQEEDRIWLDKVWTEIHDKTQTLASGNFQRGHENWLVLWDRLGTADWQLKARAEALSTRLAPCWKPDWFSRVFIQDEYFDWQLMFTADTSVTLPRPSSGGAHNDPPTHAET